MKLFLGLGLWLSTPSLVAGGGGGGTKLGLLPEIEHLQGQEQLLFMTEDRTNGKPFEDGIHYELVELEAAFWNNDDNDNDNGSSPSGKKGKKGSNRLRGLKKEKDDIRDGALVGLRATYQDFFSQELYQGEWQGLYKGKNIVKETFHLANDPILSIQVRAFPDQDQGLEFLKLDLEAGTILLGDQPYDEEDGEDASYLETTFNRPSPAYKFAGFHGYTSRETGALSNIGFVWADYAVLEGGTACEPFGETCSDNTDCCSSVCQSNGLCCAAGGQACSKDADCCSTVCQSNGLCSEYFDPSEPALLAVQTETFQDSIYAQPVVSPTAIGTHTVIEGFIARNRIQTELQSSSPGEQNFFDKNYHLGRPELIQLEDRELVHYYYPQKPRQDGVKTDGLVRHVIMDSGDVGKNARNLQSATGTFSNRFGLNVTTYGTHLLFFEQNAGTESKTWGTNTERWVVVGQPNPDTTADYPIKWSFAPLTILQLSAEGECGRRNLGETRSSTGQRRLADITLVDKYVSEPWSSNLDSREYATYDARKAVEHILIYLDTPALYVLTLLDTGAGVAEIGISEFEMPSKTARVVQIDWDPTTFYTDNDNECSSCLKNIVVADTSFGSNNAVTYKVYAMNRDGNGNVDCVGGVPIVDNGQRLLPIVSAWNKNWVETQWTWTTVDTDMQIDYSALRQVNTLYEIITGGGHYYMKLAIIKTKVAAPKVFILAMYKPSATSSQFYIVGAFPVQFPYSEGSFLQLSGGTSKFGGHRFIANDADGNLFMMRQRGYSSSGSPYDPPIYGLFDGTGSPITALSLSGIYNPFPAGTSSSTNLNDLISWQASTSVDLVSIHLNQQSVVAAMLQQALAFGSSQDNEAQGIWLGSGFQAAYAFKRFGLDSSHLTVKESSTPNVYNSIAMHKNPIDKTWHQKVIAQQTEPAAPGENESGDHYQATVTPVNGDGNVVIINDSSNPNLQIEVRADSPCTVTDDTNNYYYDVDRYTSFLTKPDPNTGKLSLVIKAEAFAQVLYVRLVDTSSLQPSNDDPALLQGTADATTYDWMTINIAAEAQQRMGNDGSRRRRLQTTTTSLADDNVYVDGNSLQQSNDDNSWNLKGTYDPLKSKNYDSVGTYLNSAGQNMIALSGDLSDPTLTGTDDPVDPLYATTPVTYDSNRALVTSTFSYGSGDVATSDTRRFLSERPGRSLDALSSVSHALHDALHWLQHAEAKFYNDLGSDGVAVIHDVEQVTVTISKSIMKLVNGVDQELQEVVSTVEEYASIIVNVIVTIVEDSFIYEFIELLIALVSLFAHLQDIQDLAKSFKDQFYSYITDTPPVDNPSEFSSNAGSYVGPNNLFDDTLGSVSSDSIEKQVSDDLLDNLMNHPFGSKIMNKITATLSSEVSLPIEFNMDETLVEQPLEDLNKLVSNLLAGAENLSAELVDDLVGTVADHATNPQQVYKDLVEKLGTLANDFDSNELQPVFQYADNTVGSSTPQYAKNLLQYNDYLTLKIPMLADLCKLLGIGTVSGSKLKLSGAEFVFFPMAMTYWVAVYMKEGKSINNINDLTGVSSGLRGLSLTEPQKYSIIRLSVNAVINEFRAVFWAGKNLEPDSSIPFPALRAWSSWSKALNNYIFWGLYPCPNGCPNTQDTLTGVYQAYSLLYATLSVAKGSLSDSDASKSTTPDLTAQVLKAFRGISSVAYLGLYTGYAIESGDVDPYQVIGQDLDQTTGIFETLYYFVYGRYYPETPPNVDVIAPIFTWDVMAAPTTTILQVKAIEDASS